MTVRRRDGYIHEFDGVRALSILAVLAAHLLPLGPGQLGLNHAAGLLGMSLFFGLSGFLITSFLYDNPDRIAAFFIRRSARILPLLWLYTLIVAVFIHGRWDSFLAVLTFTLNYRDSQLVPGLSHLWSICVEFHFYIFIGLTVWLFGRRGLWVIPVAFLTILVLRIDAGATSTIRTLYRVDEILAGGLLALLWHNRDLPALARLRVVIGKGFWLWGGLLLLSCHPVSGGLMYFRPLMGFLMLGAVLEHGEGPVRKCLRLPVLAYIASISYALYIWHPLFRLGWLGERGTTVMFYLVKRPIAILCSFALAHLTTRTIEKYFMDRGKQLERRLADRSSAPGTPAQQPGDAPRLRRARPALRAGLRG
ncbi:acyltransferase family protein [Paracoccus sp. (in: a-proteobacteria)]|uniref:acyltransferase family protein n=1 Tax=Paracoccus sp. TaxID=267 RepID=UPI003A83DB4D